MLIKYAELEWTSVVKPNKMSNKYQTDFYLENDKEARDKLIAHIDNMWEEQKGAYKRKPQTLSYEEHDDGRIRFRASQKPEAGGYSFEVGVYDSKARKIEKDSIPNIGNGTIAHLDIDFYCYSNPETNNKGITVQLKNIQIIKLVEYTSGGASFGVEEDGYELPESEGTGFIPEGI